MKKPTPDLGSGSGRRSWALRGLAGMLALALTASPGAAQAPPDDRLQEMAVDAYVYAYPMVLMETTRRLFTNVPAPMGTFAPMNQLTHARVVPDHTFREVVRPNADTFYSLLWFDVSAEPLVLSVPDAEGRYYMLPMLDMWTDVFAAPGSRTTGWEAADFAIVGPDWRGPLPAGLEPIRSPTNVGWMIGRTQVDGPADAANVHRFQDGMKVTPLGLWGEEYAPPASVPVNPAWQPTAEPPVQVARMSAEEYFGLFAELLKVISPHEMDWNMRAYLGELGILVGEECNFSELPATTQAALEAAVPVAQDRIANHAAGEMLEGWSIARQMMGSYGTAYTQRAYVALVGLGANLPEDAIYPMTVVDANGRPYHGGNRYVLHFDEDELPPVNGFWSLAMYSGEGYFVDNPLGRYSIGDRDALEFNSDGSLDIYIQNESPGANNEANWLPAPPDEFNLIMRLYWPGSVVATGEWNPPPIRNTADQAGAIR